jgi:hypothetical protein
MSDTPIEESIKALDEVRKAGKTKYIGVSEPSAATLRKAHSSKSLTCAFPLTNALQSPRLMPCRPNTAPWDLSRLPDTADRVQFETVHETDGLIDVCRELGIAFVCVRAYIDTKNT